MISRLESNEGIVARFLNEEPFRKMVTAHLRRTAYERFRSEAVQ